MLPSSHSAAEVVLMQPVVGHGRSGWTRSLDLAAEYIPAVLVAKADKPA